MGGGGGLMKSQTTANIMSKTSTSSLQKERTPYRVERNKNKYTTSDSDESSIKLKRSDMIGVGGSSDTYTKMKSNDSGYHDAYNKSYGKSMYDPEALMSDHMTRSTKKTPQPQAVTSSRQIRPYKRTETSTDHRRTATNSHDLLSDEDSEFESRSSARGRNQQLYTQRKSAGHQLRRDHQQEKEVSDSHSSNSSDFEDFDKQERDARRKEIQNLIKKYANMDDFYGRSTAYTNNADEPTDTNNNERNKGNGSGVKQESSSRVDPWDAKNKISPIRIPQKKSTAAGANPLGKSQTMANVPSMSSSQYNDSNSNGLSSWYMSNYHSNNVVPIKTNVARSSTKSRMSKALSTFVRTSLLFSHIIFFFCSCSSLC